MDTTQKNKQAAQYFCSDSDYSKFLESFTCEEALEVAYIISVWTTLMLSWGEIQI